MTGTTAGRALLLAYVINVGLAYVGPVTPANSWANLARTLQRAWRASARSGHRAPALPLPLQSARQAGPPRQTAIPAWSSCPPSCARTAPTRPTRRRTPGRRRSASPGRGRSATSRPGCRRCARPGPPPTPTATSGPGIAGSPARSWWSATPMTRSLPTPTPSSRRGNAPEPPAHSRRLWQHRPVQPEPLRQRVRVRLLHRWQAAPGWRDLPAERPAVPRPARLRLLRNR